MADPAQLASLTDRLFCKVLALQSADFNAVSAIARGFGAHGAIFELDEDVLAWREPVAFQVEPPPGSSLPDPIEVSARIAFVGLDNSAFDAALVGMVASFSALSAAARHWLGKAPGLQFAGITTPDLRATLDDPNAGGRIVGFTVATDQLVTTVSAAQGQPLSAPAPPGVVKALLIRGATGDIEINDALDLTMRDPGPDLWLEALGDIRSAYALLKSNRPAPLAMA